MGKPTRPRFTAGKGYRVRAAYAAALLGCMLLIATLYTFFGPENMTLTYALLSTRLPFFHAVDVPEPERPDTGEGETIGHTDVDPGVGEDFRIELRKGTVKPKVDLSGQEPRVLVYHTHNTEAYYPTEDYPYEEAGEWRTRQNDRNVVAVGEKLTRLLRERYGICAIHDTTNHEPPKLSTAYSRSLGTMEKYKEQYPTITMFIDVHRDAGGSHEQGKDYLVIGGVQVARIMFVVGTGEGATGTGFGDMPDFNANYALAERVTQVLEGYAQGLTRNIRVKTGRYNQHVSNQCLLAEVGHNYNTFEEAMAAVDYLAAAIAKSAGVSEAGAFQPDAAGQSLPLLP